ncbi:hypothetical protein LTR05_002756 [Lithohypha guttulata]|uniref:F-box domain-containing protein n=1 Tax=Lithohypha guttulata TaxID=1690604 RepID=A0AAN7T2Y8_9EURO|nr:hypothetical protein LTR05_002756 [Lithohypha guttulata]
MAEKDSIQNLMAAVPNAQGRLACLPPELQLYLIDLLDWPSLTALRLASSTFHSLLPKPQLRKAHILRATHLHHEELNALHRLEKEYWEQAEESFLGYHSSSYSSSSLDPDLRATGERYTCSTDKLPCYRCLKWLPSITTDDTGFRDRSMFTRGMCTVSRDLGAKQAESRVCIPCGMRTGLYKKGSRVKHSTVCYECGKLAEAPESLSWSWRDPKTTWKVKVYCGVCLDRPEVVAQTVEQYRHERRWRRYEDGMAAGKQARLERGKSVREEADIVLKQLVLSVKDREAVVDGNRGKRRYCPVMKEMRLCSCAGLVRVA